MNTKGKVKVIKKGTEKAIVTAEKVQQKGAKAASREIVSNVTNWVNEFQQRRRDETLQAIDKFFGAQPQPNNV